MPTTRAPFPGQKTPLYAEGEAGVQEQIANAIRRRGGRPPEPGDPDYDWGQPGPVADPLRDAQEALTRAKVFGALYDTKNLASLPERVESLAQSHPPDTRGRLRRVTEGIAEVGLPAFLPASMIPSPVQPFAATALAATQGLEGLRQSFLPEEDETRLGGALQTGLSALPVAGSLWRAAKAAPAMMGRLGNLRVTPEAVARNVAATNDVAAGFSRDVAGRMAGIPGAGQSRLSQLSANPLYSEAQIPERSVDAVLEGLRRATTGRPYGGGLGERAHGLPPNLSIGRTVEDILERSKQSKWRNPRFEPGFGAEPASEPVAKSLGAGARREFPPLGRVKHQQFEELKKQILPPKHEPPMPFAEEPSQVLSGTPIKAPAAKAPSRAVKSKWAEVQDPEVLNEIKRTGRLYELAADPEMKKELGKRLSELHRIGTQGRPFTPSTKLVTSESKVGLPSSKTIVNARIKAALDALKKGKR